MDHDGWHKSMSHFSFMCFTSPLNPQVLFYDGYGSHFDDRSLKILLKHNIQSFIIKAIYYVYDQQNDNGPNMKLNNLYGNAIMNWMRHHGTLKFTPAHMSSFLVATWEAFKISSVIINQNAFKKTHILSLSLPDIYTNQQACLSVTQQSNR